MKKLISLIACLLLVIALFTGCSKGGNVEDVQIEHFESEIYTQQDIDTAAQAVLDYFEQNFDGCTMKTLQYAGDDVVEAEEAVRDSDVEVIVFTSSFDVDASGGDGSLNPNSTYTGWNWIFSRTQGGQWNHVDHGYG